MVTRADGPLDPLWERDAHGYHCLVYQEVTGTLVGELQRPRGRMVTRVRVAAGQSLDELAREVEQIACLRAATEPHGPDAA